MSLTDGGKAAELNEQVGKLVDRSQNFGELLLDVCGARGEAFLANGLVGEAFNENLETILKLLESGQVSSVGVYGMGGVGKTTLAKHIHNKLLQQSQGRVFWVTVSQEFTITNLQEKMARFLGVDLSDEDNEDIRAARLHRALSRMKISVLILDDVWENIDPLKDEAWKLFTEILGNETEVAPQVQNIAKSVSKLCDGLPLGIITIAASMRGETMIHTWTNVLAELNECVMGQDNMGEVAEVINVLKYSFDRLNVNNYSQGNGLNTLQRCLLYCTLYPEDCEICREHLVRKFISEGLLHRRKSRRMHDLVRGLALKIGEGKYMVRAGYDSLTEIPEEQEWTEGLEKVSLMKSGIRRIGDGFSPSCPKLSTLLLCENPLELIPESFFSRMRGLRTLDLRGTELTKLPNSVSELKSLKALHLEYCHRLENVPYLGKLKELGELNLSRTAIKKVPHGLDELLNLEFLSMDAPLLKMLPRGLLLKLVHLQYINLPFGIQVPVEEVGNLKQLEQFSGRVKNVNEFNWFIRCRKDNTCYRIRVGPDNTTRYNGYIMGDFGSHGNELILCECNLKAEKVLGHGIVYLTASKCEGLSMCFVDDFPQLNNPKSLKRLRIESCGGT
ncbi:probable disease resistance protein At4g27220 [Salvia splendens]|uniref:probable disease resistance protein At4g27220 n=1 Tax=Salvia splendens TaxID=180675 RepID=UPI001C25D306|nr:probable disease resistance protein At4g27220 [Salvia splendens]